MFLKGRLLVRRQCDEALQPVPLLGTAEDGVAACATIASILHELATLYPGAPFVVVVVGGVSPAAAVGAAVGNRPHVWHFAERRRQRGGRTGWPSVSMVAAPR